MTPERFDLQMDFHLRQDDPKYNDSIHSIRHWLYENRAIFHEGFVDSFRYSLLDQ